MSTIPTDEDIAAFNLSPAQFRHYFPTWAELGTIVGQSLNPNSTPHSAFINPTVVYTPGLTTSKIIWGSTE